MLKGFDTDTVLTEAVVLNAVKAGMGRFGRYLKNLTAAEVALCAKYGASLWLISENLGDLATVAQGLPRGRVDGAAARLAAAALGAPATVPIFAAVDFNAVGSTQIGEVDNYMDGFAVGCSPYPLGVYGDGDVVQSLSKDHGYIAGADAWAGTAAILADPAANVDIDLIQHATVTMFGISVDPVDVLDSSVLWSPGVTVIPITAEIPTVLNLQRALNAWGAGLTEDGIYGPRCAAALAKYYQLHG